MTKFKNRNEQLKRTLGNMPSVERINESNNIPDYDSKNRQGYDSYSISDELKLISMLNTLKLEPQYYRSENDTMIELRDLIEKLALKDPYFVAQCIVYSRCIAEGMRSINHLAAALLAPFASGHDWAKRFYGLWNKKEQKGGCIFRPDDMLEIVSVFSALNKVAVTNSMRKGFSSAIEKMDSYSIFKYGKSIIDVSNLCHPSSDKSKSTVEIDGKEVKAIDALMKGLKVSADTWEVAQSGAGQEVAKAVKEGKLTKEKAEKVLNEAKAYNWKGLLNDNKIGILAAIRNIRNILKVVNDEDTLSKLRKLLSDGDKIRQGKVMPYQIDLAIEVVNSEFNNSNSRSVVKALTDGYKSAIPNLKDLLPGRNLVIVDCSGSMYTNIVDPNRKISYRKSCCEKASLIASTISLATNADIIRFGSIAKWFRYSLDEDVFSLSERLSSCNMGGTDLASAFELITRENKKYDRIFILSDNECNSGCQRTAYKSYIRKVCSPYIYSIDLASYGSRPISGDKVNYYFGYSYQMFDDIATKEFNPLSHIDKIRKIVI